ncbi:helix-turn-helix domain-containing protein, partial [Escherichia coli]|uniref:helix-turn-helix domain-containing protein n=1 Tax=Escherichia coli TaxID=562 RepID=UPI002E17C9B1|nr:helix-turn-helix domain-containing protein [Escherichia coli]
ASGMKLSSVAIMARLADFSNDEGVCWPSIETIARQIGAGMSTVRTAIARLEAEGWLTRKARRQGTKAHDLFVLPLCRKHHDELHVDTVAFEEKYGSQLELIFRFIDRALAIGVLA